MLAAGIPPKAIYKASEGYTPEDAKGRVRGLGDALAVSGGLRVLGERRKEIRKAVDIYHADGSAIFDLTTERNSRFHGLEMFDDAWRKLDGEARIPDLEKHKEFSSKGGKARAAKYRKGRMTKRDALPIWRNGDLKVDEALEIIGWSRAAAYKPKTGLGPRGVPSGPKPKKDE